MPEENWIETDIAARLDRLPWSKWHWLVVIGLGITWLLDGLEVTLASALVGMIKNPKSLGFTDTQVGMTATAYLAGAVCGAVVFGYATNLFGRKKLFFVTLILYLAATAATAFSWNFFSFVLFRFLTGAGIGGEYSAVNSAVDELIPARVRGRVDLAINSTYWIGAALGAGQEALCTPVSTRCRCRLAEASVCCVCWCRSRTGGCSPRTGRRRWRRTPMAGVRLCPLRPAF